MLAVTAVVGTQIQGARLWLSAGPVVIQTTEIVKLTLIVFLAAYLAQNLELVGSSWRLGRLKLPPLPYLAPMIIMCGLCTAALMVLNDLGTALLFFMIFMIMLLPQTGRLHILFWGRSCSSPRSLWRMRRCPGCGSDSMSGSIPGAIWSPAINRFRPNTHWRQAGFLVLDWAEAAPGSFLLWRMTTLLPQLAKNWDSLGLLAVIALYMLIATRGVVVARSAPTPFLRLLAVGLTAGIAVQAVIILAGVFRLMPLTGVTLPLVAYGGSSILVTSVMIGTLMRISAILVARERPFPVQRPGQAGT